MNFLAEDHGSALVEFSLFLAILVFLLAGVIDYSLAIQEAMQVQEAASAGAAFGAIPGNEGNLSGIQTKASSAATGITAFTVTATNLWACSPGGASVASSTTCNGGVTPYKFVVVKTSGAVPQPLSFPGMSSNPIYGSASFQVPWSQ